MKLVAIDFETANAMPESACAVGVSVFEDGAEIDGYYTLIKPKGRYRQFDWRNVRIHNITYEQVQDAPDFKEVYAYLSQYFEDAVFVAHNADFDMNVLARCCAANQLEIPDISYFCTVKLMRRMFPYLGHHRLNDCCQYMAIELDHHNAQSDAEACAQIVLNCMVIAEEVDFEEFIEHCQIPLNSLNEKFGKIENNSKIR